MQKFHLPLLAPLERFVRTNLTSQGIGCSFKDVDFQEVWRHHPKEILRLLCSAHLFQLSVGLEEPLESCEMNTRTLISPLNCRLRQQSEHPKCSALFPPPDSKPSGGVCNLVLHKVLLKLKGGAWSLSAALVQSPICPVPMHQSKMDLKVK